MPLCLRRPRALVALFAVWFGAVAFAQAPGASPGRLLRLPTVLGLDEFLPTPDDNPLTHEKVELGRTLFFDPVLSRDHRLACASCHNPSGAFADTVALSRGARGRVGRRNAPAIVNRAWGTTFFWDGRATTLEEQVLQPIQDKIEMDLPITQLLARLGGDPDYRRRFASVFSNGVTAGNIARALASYVRTIRSGNSQFDRHESGDSTALSVEARRGLGLFRGKANCSACHVGPNLSDERFHNTGVALGTSDLGRFTVTKRRADLGAFKTPTLRDVALSFPYMHDGRFATLEAVIEFYDHGGRPNPQLDHEIRPIGLSAEEKHDLAEFLRSLTGRATARDP